MDGASPPCSCAWERRDGLAWSGNTLATSSIPLLGRVLWRDMSTVHQSELDVHAKRETPRPEQAPASAGAQSQQRKVCRTGAGRRALARYDAMFDTVIVGGRTRGSIPCHSPRGVLADGAALSGRTGRRFHVGDRLTT